MTARQERLIVKAADRLTGAGVFRIIDIDDEYLSPQFRQGKIPRLDLSQELQMIDF